MRTVLMTPCISSALIGVGLLMPTAAAAEPVVIRQAWKGPAEKDIGTTDIIVDGASVNRYDKVVNTTLDFWVRVNGSSPVNGVEFRYLKLRAANGAEIEGAKPGAERAYRLSAPYTAPRSENVVNQWISPIERCNAEIDKRSGAERAAYLKSGGMVFAKDAYAISAVAMWLLSNGTFDYPTSNARASAHIRCRPLDQPKPTQGVPPRVKTEPTIKKVSLRLDPYANQTVGGQQCPTRVRMHGFVETTRAFAGQSIFMGPYFLTPITKLDFQAAGTRNVVADYPVKWGGAGAKASGPGLKKQRVTLRMNVTNADGKIVESAERTVELACRPTRVG